jgi:hypothetical protein
LFLAICNLSTEFILYVTRKRIVYVLLQVTLYYCCFVFYSSPTVCLVMIDLGVLLLFFILSTHYLFNYFYKINVYYYISELLLLFTISSLHSWITITPNQSLPIFVCFCMLAIVLSVRQFKASDYPFGIIKLFLAICNLSTEFILYVTRKRIVYVLLQITLYYCCFVFS